MSQMFFGVRLRSLGLAGATLMMGTMFAAPANAALLVYDPFGIGGGPGDYLAGDDSTGTNVIGGQNPVTSPVAGFYAGGWIQSGGDAQAVRQTGTPAGFSVMNYPQFPRSGGIVTDAVQFSCCSFGRNGREIAGGLGGGRDPQTIYQSFLVDFGNQGTDDPADYGKRGVEWWNGGIGDSFLAVDLFLNAFSGTNELTLSVITGTGTESVLVNGGGLTLDALATAGNNGVHLVVMKFEFDPAGPDVVTAYLNPTDSIEANWAPAATATAPNSDLVITHHGLWRRPRSCQI
jgi:hypothetical protein